MSQYNETSIHNYETYLYKDKKYLRYRPLSKKLFYAAAKSYISYCENNNIDYSNIINSKIIKDWVKTLGNFNTQKTYKKHLQNHFIPFLMRNMSNTQKINWDKFCLGYHDTFNQELSASHDSNWKAPQININIILCEQVYGKPSCFIRRIRCPKMTHRNKVTFMRENKYDFDTDESETYSETEDQEEEVKEDNYEDYEDQEPSKISVMLFLFVIYLIISM